MFSVQNQHKRRNQDTQPRISSRRLQVLWVTILSTKYCNSGNDKILSDIGIRIVGEDRKVNFTPFKSC